MSEMALFGAAWVAGVVVFLASEWARRIAVWDRRPRRQRGAR
jgi:hypothetical protein